MNMFHNYTNKEIIDFLRIYAELAAKYQECFVTNPNQDDFAELGIYTDPLIVYNFKTRKWVKTDGMCSHAKEFDSLEEVLNA